MTIDPLFLQETSTIAYPAHFYPADIEVSHHQLRNFISTVYRGKIFYVNKYDVYILDLDSHQRTLLVTIPFEARCLAAAHGWVCVGGETRGDCAFVHIGEENGQPGNFCHELIVKMLGKEIVNAMNIQLLKPESDHGRDELVVLISNNDHTVTIFSLCQRAVLTTIEHPQPMNYAALSPDSTIMAAVGDENKVYFMKRSLDEDALSTQSDTNIFLGYDWRPIAAPDIPRGVPHPEDFSFAVAFSPDGHLCAVSSQGGAITVFDMNAISDTSCPAEDAILCTFRSSRDPPWGCVRSLAFSPASWDLLAWAEDHGRIGLADVRYGFQRRQHLHLAKEAAKIVDIYDSTPAEWKTLDVKERLKRQHQQRMQALRGHPPVGAMLLSDDRGRSGLTNVATLDEISGLSEREQSVSQALGTIIDEADSVLHPYSINYTPTRLDSRPAALGADLRRDYEIQLLNPSSRITPSHIPRRRPSVVLSESQSSLRLVVDESSRMTMTASPGPISDDGLPPPISINDLTPASGPSSSQPLPYNIPPSDPWHVIEASLASRRNEPSVTSRQPAGLQQIENAIYAERQLAARIERQLSIEQRLSTELRSELDMRGRLLQARQQEPQSETPNGGRLSPRLERLLARQLSNEHNLGQRRSEELEDEIRNVSRRINQLMDERDTLLQRHRNSLAHERSAASSARSSALPTTLARIDLGEIERRMQQLEEERRVRAQRIHSLEQAVRTAESTIEFASEVARGQNRVRSRVRANERDDAATSSTLITPVPQSGSTTAPSPGEAVPNPMRWPESVGDGNGLSPATRRIRHRTPTELSISSNRAMVPRISELALNRVSDNDLRIARNMLTRSNMDIHGNWRLVGNPAQSQGANGPTSIEEIIRESGIGTTGIGWSPDGLKL